MRNYFLQALLLVLIAVITTAAWLGLSLMEKEHKKQIGQALQTVLETTNQAYHSWAKSQIATVSVWAQAEKLTRLTERLLAAPVKTKKALDEHEAQAETRQLLAPVLKANQFQGFFLIGPGNINLGSTRDSNLGFVNLLNRQGEILDRLWAGEALLSTPQHSDVLLENGMIPSQSSGATMFAGAPIRDASGTIIALLTFRIKPSKDFAKIFKRGRIGNSGETYAFNAEGEMLSESRFEKQLVRMGLLPIGVSSTLNIHVRDPGRNLSEKPYSNFESRTLPLTLMARNAISGKSGMNLEGYRDYRGIPVIGAWVWIPELNFGFTTEIDKGEAYQMIGIMRTTMFFLTGLSIFIVIGLVVSFHLMRRSISESEQRYRDLIEGASQGVCLHRNFTPVLANQVFADLLGFENPDAVLAVECLVQFRDAPREVPQQEDAGKAKAENSISPRNYQIEMQASDGSQRQIEVFDRDMVWKGGPVTVSTIIDVTERISLEKQLRQSQKMEAIGRLASGVAHDFNNTLQIMRGFTEIAESSEGKEKQLQALEKVKNAIISASHLTRQLLSFSRQEKLQKRTCDLNKILSAQVSMLRRIIGEDIELTLSLTNQPALVFADAVMLEQILLNLCINARDAMPDGGELKISSVNFLVDHTIRKMHGNLKPGLFVLISVTDSGIGMTPEVREKIFEPFFTTKGVGKGTGLGLSTVYGILMQHKGHIEIQSEPGLGSTFKVYLPLIAGEHPKELPAEENEEIEGGDETILVAEDDEGVAGLAREMLETFGYSVIGAVNGEEAVEMYKLNSDRVDLVLLDMVMPKMNGRAVYERIKAQTPDIPILFSTGYTGDIIDQKFIDQEKITILRKPYSSNQLGKMIREMLNQKKADDGVMT